MTSQSLFNKVQEHGLEILNIKNSFLAGDIDIDLKLECDIVLKMRQIMREGFSIYLTLIEHDENGYIVRVPVCWPEPWTVFDGLAGAVTNYSLNSYGHRVMRNEIVESQLADVLKCLKMWIDREKRLKND